MDKLEFPCDVMEIHRIRLQYKACRIVFIPTIFRTDYIKLFGKLFTVVW